MKFNIRAKFLAIFVGIAVVPLVAAMTTAIVRLQEAQKEKAVELELKIAEAAAQEVSDFLLLQFGFLDNVEIVFPEFSVNRQIQGKLVERILFSNEDFIELAIVDARGQEVSRQNRILFVSEDEMRDRSSSEEFIGVKSAQRYIGSIRADNGRLLFTIGKAISDVRGRFLGAVFAEVDARIMQDMVNRLSAPGVKGRVYVVDRTGRVVAHPDASQILAERNFLEVPIVRAIVDRFDAPQDTYKNELGVDSLGASASVVVKFFSKRPIEIEPKWFVVAEQPASVALAEVARITQFSAIILLVVLLISVLIAIFMANLVVYPIEKVHKASQALAKGALDHRVKINTGDEIEDLGNSFNQMAEQLSASIKILKKDKQVISAERNKLSVILSGISDGVVALDLDRRIILVNASAERIIGAQEKNLKGRHVDEVLKIFKNDAEISPTVFCPIRADGFEGEIFGGRDLKVSAAGGKTTYVNLLAGQISEGKVADIGCILTMHDITRERELERVKAEFVGIAAHQLRTPLTEIRWGLNTLHEQAKLSKGTKNILEKSISGTLRMIDLVNDLLNVSRVEEGRYVFKPRDADPEKIMEEVIKTHDAQIKNKNLKVAFKKSESSVILPLDIEMINLAFENLVENAVTYTPDGGEVTIEFEKQGKELIVRVKDTGIGIPEEHHYRVFDKFFRAPNAVKVHTDGSGLGLFLVKSVIEAHRGKINFQSQDGRGTVFTVTLPISSRAGKPV